MAIANYTDLVAEIIDWTHRADLASKMDNFIRLAEDVIYGDLDVRDQEVITTLFTVAAVETVALPSDFIEMRSLSLSGTTPQTVLEYLPPDEYQNRFQYDNAGQPYAYTIIGENIYLQNIPDAVYTLRAVYMATVPHLTASAPTNYLLTAYPTIYLYACLVQAAIYTKKDLQLWQGAYEKALNGINKQAWNNAAPLTVKQDVNTFNVKH